jgi:hypothetical protein
VDSDHILVRFRTDSYSCIWIQRTRCAFHEGCFRRVNKRMVLLLPSKSMACHAADNRLQRTVMDRVPSAKVSGRR